MATPIDTRPLAGLRDDQSPRAGGKPSAARMGCISSGGSGVPKVSRLLLLVPDRSLDVPFRPLDDTPEQAISSPAHRQPRKHLQAPIPEDDVLRVRLPRRAAPRAGRCDPVEAALYGPEALLPKGFRPLEGPAHQIELVEDEVLGS